MLSQIIISTIHFIKLIFLIGFKIVQWFFQRPDYECNMWPIVGMKLEEAWFTLLLLGWPSVKIHCKRSSDQELNFISIGVASGLPWNIKWFKLLMPSWGGGETSRYLAKKGLPRSRYLNHFIIFNQLQLRNSELAHQLYWKPRYLLV